MSRVSHYSSTSVVNGRPQNENPLSLLPPKCGDLSGNQWFFGGYSSNKYTNYGEKMTTAASLRNNSEKISWTTTTSTPTGGAEKQNGSQCDCCPYGFHIDLGFVQYAEDVASGQYLKHLRQLRKAKKKARQSMEMALAQEELKHRGSYYDNHQVGSPSPERSPRRTTGPIPENASPTPMDRSGCLSPTGESIFSDSLENIMSDFDETFSQQSSGRKGRGRHRQWTNGGVGNPEVRIPPKDYSSDFEVGRSRSGGQRARFSNNLTTEQGYQSDYGYAIPAQLARKRVEQKENGHPLSPTLLKKSSSKMTRVSCSAPTRPSQLPLDSEQNLSPLQKLRLREQDEQAAPSRDFNLSDSMSSLSSISSNIQHQVSTKEPRGQYSGLSVEIASNLENLSKALKQGRPELAPAQNLRRRVSESSVLAQREIGGNRGRAEDTEDPVILRAIREQMKVSLQHMRDLEEQVKNIPLLNLRISDLKQEKLKLASDLEQAKRLEPSGVRNGQLSPPETPDAPPAPPLPPPRTSSVERMRETAISPAPPPPIPPKVGISKKERENGENSNLPPTKRTRSGNTMNLEGFHSVRRFGVAPSRQARPREEDYVSDSELALGEKSLDKFSALKRSRRLLGNSGGPAAKMDYCDSTVSDTEEIYGGGAERRYYSIGYSAVVRPRALSSVSAALTETTALGRVRESPTDALAYREVLNKWREDFLANSTRPEEDGAPPSEPIQKMKSTKGVNTEPRPTHKSIAVGVDLEPEINVGTLEKSQTKVEIMKSGPCPECVGKKRVSIGIGTVPLPSPKPKDCEECKKLKGRIEMLKEKPMQFTVGSATEGSQEIWPPAKGTNTEMVQNLSIGVGVNLDEENRPEVTDFGTNTPEVVVRNAECSTELAKVCNRHTNTEGTLCKHSGTNANFSDFGKEIGTSVDRKAFEWSIGIGTEPEFLNGHGGAVVESADKSSNTDHIDGPSVEFRGTNTEKIEMCEKCTDFDRSEFTDCKSVETDAKIVFDEICETEKSDFVDSEANTDPVEIRIPAELKNASTATEFAQIRNVYVNTEIIEKISRASEAAARTRETGTNPQRIVAPGLISRTTSTNSLEETVEEWQEQVVFLENHENPPEPLETRDYGLQVELPPDDEDIIMWVQEYQEQFPQSVGGPWPPVARISVGCSEDTVSEPVFHCSYCRKPPEDEYNSAFSRHVGVGSCKVTDRVCVSCDSRTQSSRDEISADDLDLLEDKDEMEPPGLSYEQSPAYDKNKRPPVAPKPKTSRSRSIETAELELQYSSSSFTSSSHSTTDNGEMALLAEEEEEPEVEPEMGPELEQQLTEEAEEKREELPPQQQRKKVDLKNPRATRAFELSKAAAAKKMLTSEQNSSPQTFRRGAVVSKSMRVEGRKGDPLAYITEKRGKSIATATPKSTVDPEEGLRSTGLKGKVAIKQKRAGIQTNPKVGLRSPASRGSGQTPQQGPVILKPLRPRQLVVEEEDAAEAEDRLTPLPSEILMSRNTRSGTKNGSGAYENPVALEGEEDNVRPEGGRLVGDVVENLPDIDIDSSSSSSSESSDDESLDEGSYDTNGNITDRCEVAEAKMASFEMTAPLKDACDILNRHLTSEEEIPFEKLTWAQQYLQHEWLKTAARKNTNPHHVEAFLDAAETYSKQLIHKIVNLSDQNENTALHYAVSHGNFDVVSLLLDSKVCNLNRPNKAGYTPVMLAALCPVVDETVTMVIQRLFQMGDVNIKASQHGQTALMLAVSHGKYETSKMLLEAGAGVNIQDEDGSTALMCAAEHGHKDIVKLLLSHQEIDASLTDYDGSTALSIAVDNGHRDIGVLIYAHLNYARGGCQGGSSTLP